MSQRSRWSRGFRYGLALGLVAGSATAAAVFRRQLGQIVSGMRPYRQTPADVHRPTLIVNRWSGDGKAERYRLAELAAERGVETVYLEKGDDLAELAERAIDAGADAIGMAGGDGSLAAVASVAAQRDVPFFCVPAGTRNHFALDLGLDRDDPPAALDALEDGVEILIDHGVVGDRLFLNNVSLGIYPEAVKQEGYRDHRVRTLIGTATAERVDGPSLAFQTPDGGLLRGSRMVLVSNNPYVMTGPPDFGRRVRLDSGRLGVIVDVGADSNSHAVASGRSWSEFVTETVRIDSDQDLLDVGIDGEAIQLPPPLTVSTKPRALRVLLPAGRRPGGMRQLRRRTGITPDHLSGLRGE